jgi:hypothetical protein
VGGWLGLREAAGVLIRSRETVDDRHGDDRRRMRADGDTQAGGGGRLEWVGPLLIAGPEQVSGLGLSFSVYFSVFFLF